MRIPKLNLRKKRERKFESPLTSDPTLVEILSRLQTIDDYDSFETWRCEFLERFKSFLVNEDLERSDQSHNVRLRIKVDKLVRNISKIAHHVNDGSLIAGQVTSVPARNSLDDGMKSCEDISTYLKLLLPLAECDEAHVGISNFSMAAVLVQTGFKEYERLNMCRDILQVLRENFVNSVAESQHLLAFDDFEQGMISFKSIVLEDVGVLPVLKKQRQLKSPDPPKALVAEIRRGVLRLALISKSVDARQAAQTNKNLQEPSSPRQTVEKPEPVEKTQEDAESNHSELSLDTENVPAGKASDQERSIVDTEKDNMSSPLAIQIRLENGSMNERSKTKRSRKQGKSKSPLKQRQTTKPQRRLLKQPADNTYVTKASPLPSNEWKKSRNTNFDLSDSPSKLNQSPARRRNTKIAACVKDVVRDERSRGDIVNKETGMIEENNCDEKTFSTLKSFSSKEPIISSPDVAIHDEASDPCDPLKIARIKGADKKRVEVPKEKVKNSAKRARKGKQSMKNSVREKTIPTAGRGRRGLRKNNYTVEILSVVHEKSKETSEVDSENLQIGKRKQDITSNVSKCRKSPRNVSPKKNGNNSAHIGSTITKFFSESILSTKEIADAPDDRVVKEIEVQKRKKPVRSKSSKQKKTLSTPNDYKKIIHGKAYSLNAKKEMPVVDTRLSSPALLSDTTYNQEPSQSMENNSVDSELDKIQFERGEKASSNMLSSLLDDFRCLNCDEDDLVKFQDSSQIEQTDYLCTKRGKIERRQQLLGHIISGAASTSFDHDNLENSVRVIKPIHHDEKSLTEKPSFYENFIKPLTMIEQDLQINNGGKIFHDDELLERGKDIFEDSVCSSRYISGQASVAKAIARFYSDEAVVELLRLNEIGKEENNFVEKQNERGIWPSSSDDEIEESMTEMFERLQNGNSEERKQAKQLGTESDFFHNKDEYGVHDQTKEILTAEEEAARMANEVANLQIALHDVVDFDEHDDEEGDGDWNKESDEHAWKFDESENLDFTDEMRELLAGEDQLMNIAEFDNEDHKKNILTNGHVYDEGLVIKRIYDPNPIKEHRTGLDEEEKEIMAIDDMSWKLKEEDRRLKMAIEILQVQSRKDKILKKSTYIDDEYNVGNAAAVEENHGGSEVSGKLFEVRGGQNMPTTTCSCIHGEEDNTAANECSSIFKEDKESDMAEMTFRTGAIETDLTPYRAEPEDIDEGKQTNKEDVERRNDDDEELHMVPRIEKNEEMLCTNGTILNEGKEKGHTATDEITSDFSEDYHESEKQDNNFKYGIPRNRTDLDDGDNYCTLRLKESQEGLNIIKLGVSEDEVFDNGGNANMFVNKGIWKREEKLRKMQISENEFSRKADEAEHEKKEMIATSKMKEADLELDVKEKMRIPLEREDYVENEELKMMEKMLQLEAGEDLEDTSYFKVNERKSSRNFEGLWTDTISMTGELEGGDDRASKHVNRSSGSSKNSGQPNRTITDQPTKKSEYSSLSPFDSKDILPANPRHKGSPKGFASKHARKRGIGRRSLVPGKSVRALDPSTRLSRWKVPQNDFSRSSSYRNVKS